MRYLIPLGLAILTTSAIGPRAQEKPATFAKKTPKLVPLPKRIPAPKDNPATAARVELGKLLFFDPRLSGDNKMSCATCHLPEKGFADGLKTATGHRGRKLARNTQTVLNVAFLKPLFWDGRAKSLEEQALIPIAAKDEMNQDLGKLETELNAVPGYVKRFRKVFGTRVTRDGIAKALAAFQRSLVAGPSPFDRYLRGEKKALSASAKRGFELFRGDAGCIRCHNGPLLSDGRFYRIGVSFKDKGLAAVTKKRTDNYRFRTPALRNVAETAPYMHDGSMKTLNDVVMFYYRGVPASGHGGLDVQALSGQSVTDIPDLVAFLKSLSGKIPAVKKPDLPK